MGTQVTIEYDVTPTVVPTSITATSMNAAAIPIPPYILLKYGLRVISDDTNVVGSVAKRVIVLGFGPSAPATATANLAAGGSTVASVTVSAAGQDYVVPPVVSFSGPANTLASGIARLKGVAIENLAGGGGYSASSTVTFVGGLAPALFVQATGDKRPGSNNDNNRVTNAPNGPPYAINSISIINGGAGYTIGNVAVLIQGGGVEDAAGGIQAFARVNNIDANGAILGVELIDPGQGYLYPPKISFLDTTNPTSETQAGTPAKACANMGAGTPMRGTPTFGGGGNISGVTITSEGSGYVAAPTVVFFDPTFGGIDASASVGMGVDQVVVTYPGQGYTDVPTVTLTPLFESMYPDGGGQDGPFYFFPMYQAIKQALPGAVVSMTPVVA